ncbi:uncharacterized protein LOC133789741 [Humulus lupulus]|uniref:uncharacterized protein LOC133789741 n=1 Tax=Humulus lupulus TaxID=3486 RepID=UPI002B40E78F|nr:uncharacterized protein LOC133789741 [Humulus lupulus]
MNPKENASAVTLRSGTQYDPPSPPMPSKLSSKPQVDCSVNEDVPPKPTTPTQLSPKPTFVIPPPFPSRLKKTKKEEVDKEILDTFRKVKVNIPLLDAIKQVPRYAKFLKELCTNKHESIPCSTPIFLGRPFMKTARTKIDVHDDLHNEDCLEVALREHLVLTDEDLSHEIKDVITTLNSGFDKTFKKVAFLNLPISNEKLQPSIVQAPTLELKPLPEHLKYVYLGRNETLPVIIARDLNKVQEEKLMRVLQEYKTAIGWSIADIMGISPSMCMHRILLEEGSKQTREAQRRLNPPMMEVVKKEIPKLLSVGIIYPISDSQWVSPVQVVPKKSGITVVKNDENELVPKRMQTGWRVCIDYRKLNAATRKDHFPLPFIDKMLGRLAGHPYYCFLNGYSGYNQIVIAPEDQEKTTFTCPFGTFAFRRMPFGLCNAPATFQRCMMSIFSEYIENIIEVYMDDFSVYGDSFDRCLHNLTLVLQRCIETNLVLNWEKCHFMVNQGIVLGHVISVKGIEVDKAKIDLIRSLPSPTSVKEVRSFLGHAGFYRRFIKDFSTISTPLCNLLQKDVKFEFNENCLVAFNLLKESLTTAPIIQPPNWELPFETQEPLQTLVYH